MRKQREQDYERLQLITRIVIGAFAILVVRLFQLQVLQQSVYSKQSNQNHIRQVPVPPIRGLILDRNSQILVDNNPSYSLFVIPFEFLKNSTDAAIAADILHTTVDSIKHRIQTANTGLFRPVRLLRNMDSRWLTHVEENRLDLPGIFYQVEPVRKYTSLIQGSHILGYLGEVSRDDLDTANSLEAYYVGEVTGKTGIEKKYNERLKGERGYVYSEVDVRGREVSRFEGKKDVEPISGRSIQLTIDGRFQQFNESIFLNQTGSVVVLNPWTGEILSMVSSPGFELSKFSEGVTNKEWNALISDNRIPLLHRAIQAQIPPGSVFKLISAAAALQHEWMDPLHKVECKGVYWFGNRNYHCWKEEGHGEVDLLDAIRESCNIYFYQLGRRMPMEEWVKICDVFGFGKMTGIDLMHEASGLVPSQMFLDKKYGKNKWSEGVKMHLAFGQGELLVTPLQMAVFAGIIGTRGWRCPPHLVRSVQKSNGTWEELIYDNMFLDSIDPAVFNILHDGMWQAVNADGGTGGRARLDGMDVCGKTGTAENPHGLPHAWFIGFAPKNNPAVAIAVFVENGGGGGAIAAPIAGKILEYWLSKRPLS